MAQQTQQVIGYVFLALMVLFIILAIQTFNGAPTWILIIAAVIFLAVGLSLLAGPGTGSGGSGQQQSVVLGDGRVLSQSSHGVLSVCRGCSARVPETARFCPDCGHATGG